MIKVCYSELDGPKGLSLRLEAAGHAGYAPAGQDIVCAGASTLMQALAHFMRYIDPNSFTFDTSILILSIVILGGLV